MKLTNLLVTSLIIGVAACSPISGRDFGTAAPHLQDKYCESEILKANMYDQYIDPRCAYDVAESPVAPISRIIHNEAVNRG